MTGRLVPGLIVSLVLVSCSAQMARPPSTTPQHVAVTVTATTAPPGVNLPGARWIKIRGAGGNARNEQLAAVFRPPGPGPFPLVVELHGSSGLKDVDIQWAAKLASAGFVTIAGCWQPSVVPPATAQFYDITLTFIACPNLSPGGSASTPLAGDFDAISALITAGRMQPGVRVDEVGLYGMSAGGERGFDFLAVHHDIQAAVLDSPGGGPSNLSTVTTPILLLAATADEYVPFTSQEALVTAMQQAGKNVEWHYYQGGRHTLILDPANKKDAIQRIIDFFQRHLDGGS